MCTDARNQGLDEVALAEAHRVQSETVGGAPVSRRVDTHIPSLVVRDWFRVNSLWVIGGIEAKGGSGV